MKIKTIDRSTANYVRERPSDIHKSQRNYDPTLHPFEKAREYTRALNAAKLERLFSKPFLAALDGHGDAVYCLAKHKRDLQTIISGAGDGEVKAWKLNERKCIFSANAHKGIVKGVAILPKTNQFISVGSDRLAKIWNLSSLVENYQTIPAYTYQGSTPFTGVDHHRSDPLFATSGSVINIWDVNRSEPINTFEWGADTINSVKFNQTETNILASSGTDRSITLYDIRTQTPLTKTILKLKSNCISWNPMEAYHFVVGNEDHNAYVFDMRKMDKAYQVFKDHVSAIMDIDYDPTGTKIVTGSYDRTIRIFKVGDHKSKDVYHTKRMQRVFSVKFSMDSRFIISGSDDTNVRMWKATASEKLGVRNNRERAHLEYSEKLKEKYSHLPEIKRIANHRIIPKVIKKAAQTKSIIFESQAIKEMNREKHKKREINPDQLKKEKSKKKEKRKAVKDKIVLFQEK